MTTKDCPECGGSGLVALCGKDVDWSGPCVMRSGHDSPCWGEEDVAGDWTPAAPCRTCGPAGHAPGCAVFSLASYGRATPIPCTCGFES